MARTTSRMGGGRSSRILLVLALLFAIVAAVLIFVALNNGGESDEEAAEADTTEVVVAAQDISARTALTADMLDVAEVPTDNVLSGTFREIDSLEGQITRYPLLKGEQVVASKVGVGDEDEEGLSFVVPQGMRAFSIQVSEVSGVGGLLLPGDLVDVIAIFDEDEVDVDKAVTLLQSIEVLAVAQEAQEPIPPSQPEGTATPEATLGPEGTLGERPENVEPNPKARTVTLVVTPEQAQLLALVQEYGTLALSLRSFGDRSQVDIVESDLIPYGAPTKTPSP